MRGKDFVRSLKRHGSDLERDNQILGAVAQGHHAPLNWAPIKVKAGTREATIFVMRDALMVGEPGDYVRISMNADTAQRIAWHFNAYLPTTKICDAVWDAAEVRIAPQTQGPPKYSYSDMDDPLRMLDYHVAVDAAIVKSQKPLASLVANVGKHWVLTNKNLNSDRVRNYGWYGTGSVSSSGYRMIQTLGAAHNSRHADYSQILRLVKNEVEIDGQMKTFADLACDPELCALVSDEGVLKTLSIPSAARWKPLETDVYEEPDDDTPPDEITAPGKGPKELVYARKLYRGCAPGADVGEWQKFLGIGVDNKFGKITDGATRSWQRSHPPLLVDGEVGPKTIAKANEVIAERYELVRDVSVVIPIFDVSRLAFVQAKNYTWAKRTPADVQWIVIHSMESDEKPTVAEAVAGWFAGPNAPRASAHFCIDNDSIVQSVKCEHVAWHAPGANRVGIGLEHAGRARQVESDWFDEFSKAMLEEQSAPLCAYLCRKWGVPATFVDAAALSAGKPGITTHHEVSKAFKKSDHWDPGVGFPMQWYVERVQNLLQ